MKPIRATAVTVLAVVATVATNACRNAKASEPADTSKPAATAASEPTSNTAAAAALPPGSVAAQGSGEWWMPGRDYVGSRYAPLTDINVSNVQNLKVATTFSTGVLHGHEGQPLVVGSTMYVVTPYPNLLYSIDLTKPGGALNWTYAPPTDSRAVGIACCDIVNRGAVYADGKIIYSTLDAQTVAVDAKSGKEVWRTQVGNVAIGETITGAPLVVKGKVIVGNSGAELGVRGYVIALDLGSGKPVWKAYTTGPDKDVLIGPDFHPFYARDRGTDLGVKTWSKDQWKLGGGTVWGWISYDPETNLLFYSTANPGVWNPDLRPGDNKWSITLFARDPDNGQAKWAYQFVKHDAWDYDEIMENILVDQPFNGQQRKLLIHPARDGFVYTFDRTTGEILAAATFQPTNWATSVNLKTGDVVEVPAKRTHEGVVTHDICPSSTGAKDQQPSAFSPRTGLLYIPAHNVCMDYEGVEANYIAGTPYLGASVKMKPGPGGYRGDLVAWDPVHARQVCDVKEDLPLWSGVLATAGDVVFYGTMDGWFKAIDARSCAVKWQFKTGSGIVGNPIAYKGPDGKEYVAVYSGIGGWMGAVAFPDVSLDDPYTALGVVGAVPDIKKKSGMGGMLYVFTL
ncbi:MAG TPA: methanol/ethanol family PQQ-dependent dehydrogenase [Gemmatimonadaceae bacterium]